MGYYNWQEIVKAKSDKELVDFIHNSFIDTEGILAAFDELKSRKFDLNRIITINKETIEQWNRLKIEKSKTTFKEIVLKYSPYAMFIASFTVFIQFLASQNHKIDNPLFIGTLFLLFSGLFNIYRSKFELRKIQEEREREIDNIDKIIIKITTYNN